VLFASLWYQPNPHLRGVLPNRQKMWYWVMELPCRHSAVVFALIWIDTGFYHRHVDDNRKSLPVNYSVYLKKIAKSLEFDILPQLKQGDSFYKTAMSCRTASMADESAFHTYAPLIPNTVLPFGLLTKQYKQYRVEMDFLSQVAPAYSQKMSNFVKV